VHTKQGKTDKDIPNHQHVFVITRTEEEQRSLFEAFTKAYGTQTMGLYKPIDKKCSSASGNTLLHIDLDALEEIGGEIGENEWGVSNIYTIPNP
jgi:hypothetical protein